MSASLIIIILSAIGIVCGILIFMVNRFLPKEPQSLKKSEEISAHLPGVNCGACGFPGCFAYAQALAKDKNTFLSNTCATVLQEPGMLKGLEKILDIEVDPSKINKKAVVRCYGNSSVIGNYSGIKTCRAATELLDGYKKCPYGCLGLGDCMAVCPNDAISIDEEMNVAVIDPDKCIGCGLCVKECPRGIIQLVPANANIVYLCSYESFKNIPGREKCDKGCLHCKKCFRACENGAIIWNEEKAIPEFDFTRCTLCGKCIEVCPHDRLIELSNVALKEKAGIPKGKENNKKLAGKKS
ncbi:Na(+)-translocating ferredoxin:NAD(+) oxidoreductase complex subunit B [subsurface metagenome]